MGQCCVHVIDACSDSWSLCRKMLSHNFPKCKTVMKNAPCRACMFKIDDPVQENGPNIQGWKPSKRSGELWSQKVVNSY